MIKFFRLIIGLFLTQMLFSSQTFAESLGGVVFSKNSHKEKSAVENVTNPLVAPQIHSNSTAVSDVNLTQVNFAEGKDYFAYGIPIREKKLQDKIRIRFFFDYNCRDCIAASDVVNMYAGINSDKVNLEEYPVATDDDFYSAQVFYSLKAMNRDDVAEQLLFESADVGYYRIFKKLENLTGWLAKYDIDKTQFNDVFYSEKVTKQVQSAIARTEKYGVFTYPFVVIDSKYVITISTLYNDDYTFAVLDFLVNKSITEE